MNTGRGISAAVFQAGVDAMSAGYFRKTVTAEMYIMLSEIGTVFTGWIFHVIITS